jgi:hypothetical protein
VPYDVYSYSKASKTFPHESTSDQWFSESQFESYRALGRHAAAQCFGETPIEKFCEVFDRAKVDVATQLIKRVAADAAPRPDPPPLPPESAIAPAHPGDGRRPPAQQARLR